MNTITHLDIQSSRFPLTRRALCTVGALALVAASAACGAADSPPGDEASGGGDGSSPVDSTQSALAVGARQSCPVPGFAAPPGNFAAQPPRGPWTIPPGALQARYPALAGTSVCPALAGQTVCAPHTVFLPAAGAQMRTPLVVHLPGTDNKPENQTYVQQMAAYAGYRTLGISYDNRKNLGETCGRPTEYQLQLEPCANDCPGRVRREILLGQDLSPEVDVLHGDAILVRLYLLLTALYEDDLHDNGMNDLHWDAYFRPPTPGMTGISLSDIHWENIILVGFSQGGGHAGYISKMVAPVHGAFLIDSEIDYCVNGSGVQLASWTTSAVDMSAGRPRFAIHHDGWTNNEEMWPHMGIVSIGAAAANDSPLPGTLFDDPPRDGAWTSQSWVSGPGCSVHTAMAADRCMPTDTTDTTSAVAAPTVDAAWLFEPYLLRLCYACDAATCP